MQILPQNYRSITAGKWAWIGGILLLACVLFGIGTLGAILFKQYNEAQAERTHELKALQKWEALINRYPNYPEVYYNAAYYEARVGDLEKAEDYVQKSLRLNPNYTPSISLQKELGK